MKVSFCQVLISYSFPDSCSEVVGSLMTSMTFSGDKIDQALPFGLMVTKKKARSTVQVVEVSTGIDGRWTGKVNWDVRKRNARKVEAIERYEVLGIKCAW